MRSIQVSVGGLLLDDAMDSFIASSQTPVGDIILNGIWGSTYMDSSRRIAFTFVGDESSNFFTIIGLDASGRAIAEVMQGSAPGVVYSKLDFSRVTSITLSQPAAAAIKVGVGRMASSGWVRFDEWAMPEVKIQCTVATTGKLGGYTIQQTMQDPNAEFGTPYTVGIAAPGMNQIRRYEPIKPSDVTWINSPDASAVGATMSIITGLIPAPIFARVLFDAGPGAYTAGEKSARIDAIFTQFSSVPF